MAEQLRVSSKFMESLKTALESEDGRGYKLDALYDLGESLSLDCIGSDGVKYQVDIKVKIGE